MHLADSVVCFTPPQIVAACILTANIEFILGLIGEKVCMWLE